MKLYLISQNQNDDYDTYDSAVVAADNEILARATHPSEYKVWIEGRVHFKYSNGTIEPESGSHDWASDLEAIKVEYLGEAKEGTEAGIVLASFNAG